MKPEIHVVGNVTVLACMCLVAACASHSTRVAPKADAVSGATPAYLGGERGALPPTNSDYQVLGVKDGIKSWAVKYDDKLLRGGQFYAESAAAALKDWNVKTVISIVPGDKERAFCKAQGLALVEIPFDKAKGPSDADIRRFLDTIKTGTSPFYVHCVGGTHRGGVLGVAYRVHIQNWSFERALVEFGRLGGDLREDHLHLETVKNFKP
jgi:protein tyrosine phosphatase (PTP) superfamily phosphohydrolase (DUF442 family)